VTEKNICLHGNVCKHYQGLLVGEGHVGGKGSGKHGLTLKIILDPTRGGYERKQFMNMIAGVGVGGCEPY